MEKSGKKFYVIFLYRWRILLLFFMLILHGNWQIGAAQVLPASRSTDWSTAGLTPATAYSIVKLNMQDFGADPSGILSSYPAFLLALNSLSGPGILYFPAGTYFFDHNLSLTDGIVLLGAGASATTLKFDLGGSGHLIQASGGLVSTIYSLSETALKGQNFLVLDDPGSLGPGDVLKLYMNDADLVTSDWANGSVAHIVEVTNRVGNSLFLDQELRLEYNLTKSPKVRKINPKRNIGVECLRIVREDATTSQTDNIFFNYTMNCWVKGVESYNCNFSHVTFQFSSHGEVTGSYFHHGFDYGGGGKAYGVVLQFATNLCLVENNYFDHLRHSILLQAGPNGNVISFNYSTDPFWSNGIFSPSNSAGDMVLHGNYPFMNLFEHNIVQNIIIDNSHGPNGPNNCFFRNRAELYGIVMTASNSPIQSFIGNEITNTGGLYGNYSLSGAGHFEYGNNRNGTIIPSGTGDLSDLSYYYASPPDFLTDPTWPFIGPPEVINTNSIPARDRVISNSTLSICPDECGRKYGDWKVWTGCGGNTNWSNPTNWEGNSIPITGDHVFIPLDPNGGYFPILDANVQIELIQVEQGATFSVPLGYIFCVKCD